MKEFSDKELLAITLNQEVRRRLARESHLLFFSIYLSQYITYPFAPFHKELFALSEDQSQILSVIAAFRGSAKSTIFSLSYPIWAITGKLQKKFVLLLAQTQSQAKLMLTNIKKELENNQLLKADIGPFEEDSNEWGAMSLVIPKYGARIMVASSEQSIRGIRHGAKRPDLIICDDLEDLASVKTKEGRDKTYQWFTGDIRPAGDLNTKVIIIGTYLHEDSLLMRLKIAIVEKHMQGVFKEYPLLNDRGDILWLGKYPNQEAVVEEKQKVGSEVAWYREYLLRIISDESRVVWPDWIQYYHEIPELKYLSNDYRFTAIGIDLAISIKTSADCTAMIAARIFGYRDSLRIYILPHPVNERLNFPDTISKAKALAMPLEGKQTKFFVEEVSYQKAFPDQLKEDGYLFAEGIPVHGQDKRERLVLTTDLIRTGKVLFPIHGAEDIIEQLIGFGVEKFDDLADAFSILILKIIDMDASQGSVYYTVVDFSTPPPNPPFSDYFNHTIDWNNEEERKELEKEADLQLMREAEQQARNGL